MTEQEIKTKAAALVELIYYHQYFVPTWEWVLAVAKVTNEDFANKTLSRTQIISIANKFWQVLPDAREIQRIPFYDLCDICEEMFNDDESQQ